MIVVVLGGIGTLVGRRRSARRSWCWLEDRLSSPASTAIGLVTGRIFVVVVLLFRRGIWGTARDLLARAAAARRRRR